MSYFRLKKTELFFIKEKEGFYTKKTLN